MRLYENRPPVPGGEFADSPGYVLCMVSVYMFKQKLRYKTYLSIFLHI